jgi:hypothetical protein
MDMMLMRLLQNQRLSLASKAVVSAMIEATHFSNYSGEHSNTFNTDASMMKKKFPSTMVLS